jgi:serine/threonine protein kinase
LDSPNANGTISYLGPLYFSEPARGLLFEEAPNGDVQQYLNAHGDSIDIAQRLKWCKEVAEGLSYCHRKGIFHCDLRPDNLLLDCSLSIQICDFGGSVCGELDGGGLPDYGFFDPREEDIFTVTESMEVFGLGSIMYSIMTGHRPHGPSIFKTTDEIIAYGEKFGCLIRSGIFPDTTNIKGGDIIHDCWTKKVPSAKDAWERLVSLEEKSQI